MPAFEEWILLEDNHLLVLHKPPGIAVQGDGKKTDLTQMAQAYLKEKYHKPGHVFCAPAHRLDTNASGIVVMARTSRAARRLALQFREHLVRKFYLALVPVPLKPGLYEDRLLQDKKEKRARADPSGKEARMLVLQATTCKGSANSGPGGIDSYSELRLELLTGRYHQLRCQLALRGTPILGDRKYGSTYPATRIYLHAERLELEHPVQHKPLAFTCPPEWDQIPASRTL